MTDLAAGILGEFTENVQRVPLRKRIEGFSGFRVFKQKPSVLDRPDTCRVCGEALKEKRRLRWFCSRACRVASLAHAA
jgi:hypothetical protein